MTKEVEEKQENTGFRKVGGRTAMKKGSNFGEWDALCGVSVVGCVPSKVMCFHVIIVFVFMYRFLQF